MKRKCTASGNPLREERHWSDAWWIMLEMAICASSAVLMLFIDIYDGIEGGKDIREAFVLRLRLVLDEIPLHLRSTNYKED